MATIEGLREYEGYLKDRIQSYESEVKEAEKKRGDPKSRWTMQMAMNDVISINLDKKIEALSNLEKFYEVFSELENLSKYH